VPRVSVVTPLYQTEVHIAQALRTVPSQTFTDSSGNCCAEASNLSVPIKVLRNKIDVIHTLLS
jgi:hypothetical protein